LALFALQELPDADELSTLLQHRALVMQVLERQQQQCSSCWTWLDAVSVART